MSLSKLLAAFLLLCLLLSACGSAGGGPELGGLTRVSLTQLACCRRI